MAVKAKDPALAIEVQGLRKSYGSHEAVRGVDLEVATGQIFALLGPNGAGKTTTVEVLEGYRPRTGGEVRVLGTDPGRAPRRWRARVGVVLQTCQVPPQLTVRESLAMFAAYYPAPRPVEATIDLVGLRSHRDRRAGTLSGGQQRRLDLGLALIGDPELIFLDEPTTGFDPSARREAWATIAELRALGKTVLLTTHSLEEAEQLADQVSIIAQGRVVAEGTPSEIGRAGHDAATITFRLTDGLGPEALPGGVRERARVQDRFVTVASPVPDADLRLLLDWAGTHEQVLAGLEVRRESLEDVYLRLTAPEGAR